jgi:hypothetical protein
VSSNVAVRTYFLLVFLAILRGAIYAGYYAVGYFCLSCRFFVVFRANQLELSRGSSCSGALLPEEQRGEKEVFPPCHYVFVHCLRALFFNRLGAATVLFS